MCRYTRSLLVAVFLFSAPYGSSATRFYPDDPVQKEPPPVSIDKIAPGQLNALVDFYKNSIYEKGERHSAARVYPSIGANTLGELPDSLWFTNRHSRLRRLSREELTTGPNRTGPPVEGSWTVVAAKAEGVTPGFSIKDAKGNQYLLKFDPLTNPEMATGADVVTAKFLYAMGYNVPENHIVYFRREQLSLEQGLRFTDFYGRDRELRPRDIDEMLALVPKDSQGRIRAVASFFIPGKILSGFKFYKRRIDDPNEIGPHEHMRVLRGLYVCDAWLNHTDAKALNTLDVLVEEDGRRAIKHYLIDFGSSLGSDSLYAKDARLGHEFVMDTMPGLKQLATLGIVVPRYARADFPNDPAAGNIESKVFDPDNWRTNYPNAAFANRLPGDEYWGAKKVMAFSDEDIRAIVETGQYTNPNTVQILTDVLKQRRDKIGRTFFAKLTPVDNFRVEGDRLAFDDLAAVYRFRPAVDFMVEWARFDNQTGQSTPLAGRTGLTLPSEAMAAPAGAYFSAVLRGVQPGRAVTVYLRRDAQWQVVGVDREGADRWEPK